MGTGQTLTVIGALVLLSIVLLSINGAILSNSEVVMEGKVASLAISLGQQIIEEAIPRSMINFETIYTDYHGRRSFYRYIVPETGCVADYTVEELAGPDSALADFSLYVAVDTTVGVGMSEMVVTVASPYLEHGVALSYVFARQY